MRSLLGLVLIAMVLVCVSYSQAQELTTSQTDTLPTPTPSADVVITVDRNPKVQTMVVEGSGLETKTFPISTGRETFDFNEGNYKVNPYCSFTETNYEAFGSTPPIKDFSVQLLRELNVSDKWSSKDADGNIVSRTKMNHSVFFNGGTAFHAVDISTEYGRNALKKLGPKESPSQGGSGACVRLAPENAKYIFDLLAAKDAQGNYTKRDPRTHIECQVLPGQQMNHKCAEPEQWPVVPKKLNVQIRIIDTRDDKDELCAHQTCNSIKENFTADKNTCIVAKANALLNLYNNVQNQAVAVAQPARKVRFIDRLFGRHRDLDPVTTTEPLAPAVQITTPAAARSALAETIYEKVNEECNREGHQKIKDGKIKSTYVCGSAAQGITRPRARPATL